MANNGPKSEVTNFDETPVLLWIILAIVVLSITAFLVLHPSPSGRGHRSTASAVSLNRSDLA